MKKRAKYKRAKYRRGMLPPPPALGGLSLAPLGKVSPAPWGLVCATRRGVPVLLVATVRRVRTVRLHRDLIGRPR